MTLVIKKPTSGKLVMAKGQPVVVDPFFSNVALLLHGDGANNSTTIIDSSPSPKIVTAFGNAKISTTQTLFGKSSLAFDGSGDYLTAVYANDFNLGTNDFTIEMWFYVLSVSNLPFLFTHANATSQNWGWFIELGPSNVIYFGVGAGSAPFTTSSASAYSLSAWTHLACTRVGSTISIYANGVRVGQDANPAYGLTQNRTTDIYVGRFFTSPSYDFNGFVKELRVTRGVARYSGASFTPPTAPFPDF